jgi:hypothetical protein
LQPVDLGRYEAVVTLADERVVVPATTIDGHALVGPAVCLPYSPEAEPRFGRPPGAEVLAGVARDGNGRVRHDLLDAFTNAPSPGTLVDISRLLLISALVLAVLEILVRRLRLAWRQRTPAPAAATAAARGSAAPVMPPPPVAPPAGDPSQAPPPDEGLHEALRQLRKRR